MLIIIFSWICLFAVMFLLGKLFLNNKFLSFLKLDNNIEWYEYFWVGLAIVFAISQIWSLFLPVNIYSLLFIIVLSIISAILLFRKGIKLPKVNLMFVIITVVALFIVSYFASLSGGWPDTYGYHLGAVKWINTYGVVPGLANLYTPLGLNSSFFTFVSMIGNLFFKERVSHIALSLMASVLLIEYIWLFFKSKNNYLKTFILLSSPIFIEGIIHTVQVSSLSYDFALLIVILVICVELIFGRKINFFMAAFMALMLSTIKLSGIVFAFLVVAFTFYKLIVGTNNKLRIFYVFIVIATVFLSPYIIRNIILSGWSLYPLPLLGFKVPWALPYDGVLDVFTVNRAWAILPGMHFREAIGLSFIQWFPGWVVRNIHVIEFKIFVVSILFIIGSFIFKYINISIIKKNIGQIVCVLISFASIIYLILSAPDFRFGSIFFWVFFASLGSYFFVGIFKKHTTMQKIFFALIAIISIFIYWPPRIDSELMLKSLRWDRDMSSGKVLITPNDGSTPFEVYTTGLDGNCGNSKLPCTSVVNNNFKENVPGDLSRGFSPAKKQ